VFYHLLWEREGFKHHGVFEQPAICWLKSKHEKGLESSLNRNFLIEVTVQDLFWYLRQRKAIFCHVELIGISVELFLVTKYNVI
jgi:hypothetical protein